MGGGRLFSASRRQVRWFVVLSAISAAAFFGLGVYFKYMDTDGRILASDYAVYRFASLLLWDGDFTTLFDLDKFLKAHEAFEQASLGFSPFPYPPSAAWVVAPLKFLPDRLGLIAWLGLTFAAFAWPVCRQAGKPWLCALALFLAPGSIVNITTGQNGFLTGALLSGGLLCLQSRPVLAGLLLGLLSYKPQFGLLLPFILLAGGYFRTFAIATAVTLALIAGSLILLGAAPWLAYLQEVLPAQRAFLENGERLAILTTPSFFVAGRLIGVPIAIDYGIQAMATGVILVACVVAFRRRTANPALQAALVMVGAFLATPYCSSSDLGIVAAAQILVFAQKPHLTPGEYLLHALVWALPLLLVAFSLAHLPIGPIVLSIFFYRLLKDAGAAQPQHVIQEISPAAAR
jgi:hypothetical protein